MNVLGKSAESEASASASVLLVEDNVDALEWLVEIVGYLGHQAVGCVSAEEALQALAGRHFDLLVTDVSLAGMSGLDLARQARENQPGLAIAFASGYPRGPNIPADIRWMQKPFSIEDLSDTISAAHKNRVD